MRRLLPLLCGLLLAACGQRAARPIGDFTLPVYTPRYASGFEITGAAGSRSTLVTVHNPWYGDEVTDQYLFIARDGEPAPAGFEGQVLRDEARRVVCMSGSYIAMLDALGAADRVVGVSGAAYGMTQGCFLRFSFASDAAALSAAADRIEAAMRAYQQR